MMMMMTITRTVSVVVVVITAAAAGLNLPTVALWVVKGDQRPFSPQHKVPTIDGVK
jgi:hypothetical protein